MNYILRYTGSGIPNGAELNRVLKAHNITVLDNSSFPKMVLLGNVAQKVISIVKGALGGPWEFYPQQEQKYRVPDTRHKL